MNDADELRIARAAEAGLHRKQATNAVVKILSFIVIVGLIVGIGEIGSRPWSGYVVAAVAFGLAVLFLHKRTHGNL